MLTEGCRRIVPNKKTKVQTCGDGRATDLKKWMDVLPDLDCCDCFDVVDPRRAHICCYVLAAEQAAGAQCLWWEGRSGSLSLREVALLCKRYAPAVRACLCFEERPISGGGAQANLGTAGRVGWLCRRERLVSMQPLQATEFQRQLGSEASNGGELQMQRKDGWADGRRRCC
jgi:hypothetical protein